MQRPVAPEQDLQRDDTAATDCLRLTHLVLAFGSSSKLASAHGIAVTGTMVVTATRTFVVARRHWAWSLWAAVALITPFLMIDLVFFGSDLMNQVDGGYVPRLIAGVIGTIIWTWVKGTPVLSVHSRQSGIPLCDLLGMLDRRAPGFLRGTAIELTAHPDFVLRSR